MAAQESLLRCETARRVVVVLLPSQTVLADDLFLAKRQAEFELYPFEWHFAEVGRQMPNRITVLLVVVATTALITAAMAGSLRQDTFRDASAAFQRRDYSTAFQKFKMLADHGDPIAQDFLATMYSNGWGVRKSEVEGIKWYRRAAAQGFPHAQIMPLPFLPHWVRALPSGVKTCRRSLPLSTTITPKDNTLTHRAQRSAVPVHFWRACRRAAPFRAESPPRRVPATREAAIEDEVGHTTLRMPHGERDRYGTTLRRCEQRKAL
jgi:hypothetical protein